MQLGQFARRHRYGRIGCARRGHYHAAFCQLRASHGLPDYPFVVIPHPIAATARNTLQGWADQVTDQVVGIFLHTTG